MSEPQPVDRVTIILALFAFGLVNLAVVLYFADVGSRQSLTILLLIGVLCGIPAWIRLRR